MDNRFTISVASGDGIGPEITDATLRILEAAQARLHLEYVSIGEVAYQAGYPSGFLPSAWDSIRKNKVLLKAPVASPGDNRYKSPNVILRKMLGMYANVRPCKALAPFVATQHPDMDVVIIRENEEDFYAGIEHRQCSEVTQCTRLISRPGSEKIIRYAFEYARAHYREKVTCFSKDNVLKLTDGLFHKVFNRIAQEYPDIEHEHWIVDVGTARLADTPENFDVLVVPNLYGDILNDMTAQLAGSIGMAGSANFGTHCAMFETIHGAVKHRAGKDMANPSGMIMAAVMMLNHIGQPDIAEWVHNAWLSTLEAGLHTYDIYSTASQQRVGTRAFADAVIARLGEEPKTLAPVRYERSFAPHLTQMPPYRQRYAHKELYGVDIFFDDTALQNPEAFVARLNQLLAAQALRVVYITNRGVEVWPRSRSDIFLTDHWCCRLEAHQPVSHQAILTALDTLAAADIFWLKTEHLYTFDGIKGYSSLVKLHG